MTATTKIREVMLRYVSFRLQQVFFFSAMIVGRMRWTEKSTASAAAAAAANLIDGSNIWHQILGGFSPKTLVLESF